MSIHELPGIEQMARSNGRLKSLMAKHKKLDLWVNQLNQRIALTPKEEEQLKDLKLQKLKIKEEIMRLYEALKGSADQPLKLSANQALY